MAVPKTLGIETEFGILHRGTAEPNPVQASSLLINAYLSRRSAPGEGPGAPRVGWDFIDESPAADIRGFSAFDAIAPEIETHLVNAVLTNGARYYVDHAHPELSTPECLDPLEVVRFDRAAELILVESMAAANEVLPEGQELVVYKNNSDGKGNSYGCHENYLVDRATPFGRIVTHATTHFVTRQVFTGAGKVGCEQPGRSRSDIEFQLTQRADFFEEEVGLETTLKRPIINTRDEPHADPLRYRRLHVIVGDANLCEVATFLKVGTTAIVLAMVEDDFLPREVRFADPVLALQQVSRDVDLRQPLELDDGSTVTALDVQWDLLEQGRKYLEQRGNDGLGGAVADQVLDRSLFARLGAERLVEQGDAEHAMTNPPDGTRAYFRGRCLERWPDRIVAANWDSMVFDAGEEALRRVPMMEPTRGSRAHVATLIDESEDVAELLERLSGRSD